jgi:hypothetical protein
MYFPAEVKLTERSFRFPFVHAVAPHRGGKRDETFLQGRADQPP